MKDITDKLIVFPIPGNKRPNHSKKIEWVLRNFITSMGEHYYDDEIKDGILYSYFKLDHDICVEQKICIGEIRFRTHLEVTERTSPQEIDKFGGYPKHIINKYGHMFPAYLY